MSAPTPGTPAPTNDGQAHPKPPFVPTEVDCPVCGTRIRNWSLRKSMFEVEESDLAGNPIRVKWNEARWQWVRPMDFALWFCPACHFVDVPKAFREEKARSKHFDLLQEAIRAQRAQPQGPLGLIGRAVDVGADHLASSAAFLITLAGLLAHLHVKPAYRDAERMAYLYLRAAAYLGERDPAQALDARVLLLLAHVRKMVPDLPEDAADATRRGVAQVEEVLRTAREIEPRREAWLLRLVAGLTRSFGTPSEAVVAARRWYERTLTLRNETRERLQKERALVGGAREKVQNLLEWLGHQSDDARDLHQAVLGEVVTEELARLKERLRDQKGPIGDDLAQQLLAEGFHEETIRRYASEGGPTAQ